MSQAKSEKEKQEPGDVYVDASNRGGSNPCANVSIVLIVSTFACIITALLIGGGIFGVGPLAGSQAESVSNLSNTIVSAISARSTLIGAEVDLSLPRVRVNYEGGIADLQGFRIDYTVTAEISAGVDLSRDRVTVEQMADNRFQITLPAVELTGCTLQPLIEINRTRSLLLNEEREDAAEQAARIMALPQFTQDAVEHGIIDEAERNIRNNLADLLSDVVSEITETEIIFDFVFEQAGEIIVDDTCDPGDHLDWQYYPDEGVWRILGHS